MNESIIANNCDDRDRLNVDSTAERRVRPSIGGRRNYVKEATVWGWVMLEEEEKKKEEEH